MTAQNKLIFVIVIFLIILGFVLYGATDNKNTDKIKIGIISPSTGVVGFLGKNVLQSAQLAIDDLNLNNDVQLVVEDAGNVGGSSDAINAYNKLVKIDGVKLIIDGMSSDSTMSIAPLLEKDKVVMITPLTVCKHRFCIRIFI
jgi:branched-chain amino acid transport system substrate-binding protein